MMFEVGKLYICNHYLIVYSDKESALHAEVFGSAAASTGTASAASAAQAADYWSKRFKKSVRDIENNIPLLILNNEEKYIEVLVGDKSGWIIYRDWLNLKEIE